MKTKRMYRKILIAVLAGLLIVTMALPVFATENKGKTVKVACNMNDMLYIDDNGELDGIGLPYIRQLAWNNNWNLEYVKGSYNEGLERLANGEVDLMFPIGADDDHDGKLAYSKLTAGFQNIGLFARDDADIYYNDYKGFNNKKVGISIGSNSELLDQFARENKFTYEKVELNTTKDKIEALNKGKVDMIAFSTLNNVKDAKLVAVLDQVPFYICTAAGNTELIKEINSGMSEILVETPEISTDLYRNSLEGNTAKSYTREEHNKISKSKAIVFGVYGDRPPLASVDSEGRCSGIYVDFLKEIAKESNLTIEIKAIKDSNQLYSYIDDGTVDFVIGIQELRFSQKNADNHLSSNHIVGCKEVAITNNDYQLDKVKNPVIGLTKDRAYLEDKIKEWFPKAKIKYFDNRRICLDAINDGESDVTFLNQWEYNYEIKNDVYSGMHTWESYQLDSGITLGGSRDSDLEILSILEKTIGKIPTEKITDAITTNANKSYSTFTLGDRIYNARVGIVTGTVILLAILGAAFIYGRGKKKYIHELEFANKVKTEFLSRMSHELRTPLNAINGYTTIIEDNLLEEELDKETTAKSLKAIKRAVKYQLSLVDDLLDIHQLETGNLELHSDTAIFDDLLNHINNMIEPEAAEKNIKFTFNRNVAKDAVYDMDVLHIQQVILNLLHNAIKFTPASGEVVFTVNVEQTSTTEHTIAFIVSDNGIGMSEEFQKERLFTPFAQEYAGNTSPYEGSGTGLGASKEIVDMMGGTIKCVSVKDEGSTFTVIIPAKVIKKSRRTRNSVPTDIDLTGVRLLLCEDNKMNQDMERRLLNKINCQVDVADDGAIALQMFENSAEGYYDVILMDIRMPNMDGWECTEKIRNLDRDDAKVVPILAVSANAFDEDIKYSLEVGMTEHLAKPVDIKELYEKIKKYCKMQ